MAGRKKANSKSPDKPPKAKKSAADGEQTRTNPAPSNAALTFPVVGLGASAGGLRALQQFCAAMPADTGMAFVLVQHLDPTHESLTDELLSRHTRMPVVEVAEEMRIEPDHVYVIPPNKNLAISGQTLQLSEPLERRGLRLPIDFFFRSLAEDRQERAIGIVFSGAGSDGTLGVREIKAAGGMVMVQSPETAQFDPMPRSAVATGMVDYVLPIEEMPELLMRYARHWYINGSPPPPPPTAEKTPEHLPEILGLLRGRIKHDFSCYKHGTLMRRIQRRMGLKHIEKMGDYVRFLRRSPDEASALYKDLLISVTNFFREPEVWEQLDKLVMAQLVRSHDMSSPIRVWVPGCATGEEAYSIAILLVEQMQAQERPCEIQIFASDIDQEALAFARSAVYPENIAADVSPDRLRRFFSKGEHTYRVNKEIRETVVFAEQNLISDPPFSKLDLISCRNLLIYLDGEIQKKIFNMFHFALREGGFVLLGSSETLDNIQDLFEPVARRLRIYRRLGAARREKIELPIGFKESARFTAKPALDGQSRSRRLGTIAQELMVTRYSPPYVLINRKLEVLYINGAVDGYLKLPSGELGANLLTMARDGLRTKLRNAVNGAIQDNRTVTVDGISLKGGRARGPLRVTVEPLRHPKDAEGLLLVTFLEHSESDEDRKGVSGSAARTEDSHGSSSEEYEATIQQLELDIYSSGEDLQSMIEELETSNEEFKAANEEVTSVNEELQSANEELETSKEELQSLNEELHTVNSQLEQKVSELESTNDDLANLLASSDIPTIFLDRSLRIKRFTPAAMRMLRLLDVDQGRPFSDISRSFDDEELVPHAELVLEQLAPREREVVDNQGRCYVRRIVPYRTEDNRIDGVVITFTDITSRHQYEQQLKGLAEELEKRVEKRTAELEAAKAAAQESEERFRALFESAPDAVIVYDLKGKVLNWNRGAQRLFGYAEQEIVGRNIGLLYPPERHNERSAVLERLRRGEVVEDFETVRLHKDGERINVAVAAALVQSPDSDGGKVCKIVRDLRESERLKQQLAEMAEEERQSVGRELHDSLGQQISALGMLVAALSQKDRDSEQVAVVRKLEASVDQAKQQLRRLTKGLFPVAVDSHGLRIALEELAQEITQTYKIDCRFDCEEELPLANNFISTQLFFIAREAVFNAVKHARAGQIVIGLQDGDGLNLSIRDDGEGLAKRLDSADGMGLRIMTHRSSLIGGALTIESLDGQGTVVRCAIPKETIS